MKESKFTGSLEGQLIHSAIAFLIVVITIGIATPWAVVYLKRWETKHTYIEGKQLEFKGTAIGLFGQWIKWFLFTIITFGIYGFFVKIKMKQWIISHTKFK